ncbi:MAG: hypothetical protein NkDv07_0259 [Candidatus Improbicoccus devescovinae]|nr:MAG: hypothetical protein NkDv07_0259 [Candidatus Improbicoccus devescovinae]
MDMEKIIDEIEDLLEIAWKFPFIRDKAIVNVSRLHHALQNLRRVIPSEVINAKNIVNNRDRVIQDAKIQCDKTFKDVEKKIQLITSESEIVKSSKREAKKIITEAVNKSEFVKNECHNYVKKVFEEAENLVSQNLEYIKKSHKQLQTMCSKNSG